MSQVNLSVSKHKHFCAVAPRLTALQSKEAGGQMAAAVAY
jgi:hypothetical protein